MKRKRTDGTGKKIRHCTQYKTIQYKNNNNGKKEYTTSLKPNKYINKHMQMEYNNQMICTECRPYTSSTRSICLFIQIYSICIGCNWKCVLCDEWKRILHNCRGRKKNTWMAKKYNWNGCLIRKHTQTHFVWKFMFILLFNVVLMVHPTRNGHTKHSNWIGSFFCLVEIVHIITVVHFHLNIDGLCFCRVIMIER